MCPSNPILVRHLPPPQPQRHHPAELLPPFRRDTLPADLCQTLPEPPQVVLPLWSRTSRVWATPLIALFGCTEYYCAPPLLSRGCMMIHSQEEVGGELTSKEVAPTVGTLIQTDTLPKLRRKMAPLIGLMKVVGSPGQPRESCC